MLPRNLVALTAALIIGSATTATARDNYLSGAIREAAGLAPAYEFAQQCAARGEISTMALSDYRDRVLSAIEEKYTLDFDEVTVAEEYLIGSATASLPLIYPSAGTDRQDNCATATSLM